MAYDQIIGIDFGHGEVSAHCAVGKKIFQLILDPRNKDKTMITAIAYDDRGNILIGANAKALSNVIPYFKASPSEWDEKIHGKSKKELMRDFLGKLIKQIAEANKDDITVSTNKTLLLVGCPSSETWTGETARQQYAELVREATGIQNVRIIPESRAAIFSAFVQADGLQIDANRGIAIFDFGSSTADFTYIQLGKCEVERSWTLGASMIEQMIVRNEMERLRAQGLEIDIPDLRQALEARGFKERFFDELALGVSPELPLTLKFTLCEGGRPRPLRKDGNVCYDKSGKVMYEEVCPFPALMLNEEYMNACLIQDVLLPVCEDGNTVYEDESRQKYGSWMTLCHLFFETMKTWLDQEKLPCERVVLTGGASRMMFVEKACRDVFKKSKISVDQDPSGCVSKGLCYLGQGQENMPVVMDKYSADLRQGAKADMTKMLDGYAKAVTPILYDEMLAAFCGISGTHKIKEVIGVVTDYMNTHMDQISERMTDETDAVIDQWKNDFSGRLDSYASAVAKECYPGLEGKAPIRLSQKYIEQLQEKFKGNMSPEYLLKKMDIRETARRTALSVVSDGAFAVMIVGVLLGQFWLIPFALLNRAADKVSAWYAEHADFKVKKCEKIAKQYEKNADYYRKLIENNMKCEVQKSLEDKDVLGADFVSYLDDTEESGKRLAKIVTLQDFDL